MLSSRRNKSTGWIVGGALAAVVVVLTGCSNSAGSDADKAPTATGSPASDTGKSGDAKAGDASASAQTSAVDQSTAEGTVAGWVTAVIKNRPKEACLLMGEAATDSSPARAGTESTCGGDDPQAKEIRKNITQIRTSFTPKPATANPTVVVARVAPTGDEVVTPADKVTIDGQTLDKIILSHSTGVTAGQLDVKVHSTKIDDAWYVTDLDFNIG